MLNNLRIPRNHLRKLVAWELTTQAVIVSFAFPDFFVPLSSLLPDTISYKQVFNNTHALPKLPPKIIFCNKCKRTRVYIQYGKTPNQFLHTDRSAHNYMDICRSHLWLIRVFLLTGRCNHMDTTDKL